MVNDIFNIWFAHMRTSQLPVWCWKCFAFALRTRRDHLLAVLAVQSLSFCAHIRCIPQWNVMNDQQDNITSSLIQILMTVLIFKLWKELSKCWYDCKIIILTIIFYSIIGDFKKLNNSPVIFVTLTDISIIWMQQWTCVSSPAKCLIISFSPLTD